MQMMISDVTYALDYEVAAELVEVLDLEFRRVPPEVPTL